MKARQTLTGAAIAFALAMAFGTAAPVERAQATAVAGATEMTQVTNFMQLLDQSMRMGRQVKMMKSQLEYIARGAKALGQGDISAMRSFAWNLRGLMFQLQSTYYWANGLHERYSQTYPGYKKPLDTRFETVKKLEAANQKTLQEAVKSIEIQMNHPELGMAADDRVRKALLAKSETVEGTMQAVQVGNELLGELVRQVTLLRAAFLNYHQMVAFLEASKVQKRQDALYRSKDRRPGWGMGGPGQNWAGANAL